MPDEKKHGISFPLTLEELELLQKLATLEGTGSRNAIRRGLRLLAEKHQVEIKAGEFKDKAKGNFRENRLTESEAVKNE